MSSATVRAAAPELPMIINPPARLPMSQQLEAFEFAYPRVASPLFMEPGTGKTKSTMMLAGQWWLDGTIEALVVLAPNGVHRQWVEEEAAKDMPLNVPWRGFAWRRANSQAKYDAMAAIARPDPASLLLVTFNFESVITKRGQETLEWLLKRYKCALVIDESSRIRNPSAKRTKLALKMAPHAVKRLALTGTPNPKGYENLWAQYQFVDPGIIDCRSFTAFKQEYCRLAPVPGVPYATRIVGYQRTDELMERVKPHTFTKKKRECLDLPPVLIVPRKLGMTPEQRKAYKSMYDLHMTELNTLPPEEPQVVMVQRVIAARTKLRQIAIGFVFDDAQKAHWITHNRLNRIIESLEDSEDKVIVWTPFNPPKYEIAKLLEKAGISFMNDEDPGAQTEFNSNDKRVLLAHPQRSGIGFNMASVGRHIWIGPVDDEELRIQARDRTHRIGQTMPLTVEDYEAPGTVEGTILRRGIDKAAMLELVMRRDWRVLLGGFDDDSDWTEINEEGN